MARKYNLSLQYTEEQAQAIKSGNIPARNKFYFDNLKILRSMAWAYKRKFAVLGSYFTVEDLLQQLYLDLPYLDYKSPSILSFWIYSQSFRSMPVGGLSFLKENHCIQYQKPEYTQFVNNSTDERLQNGDEDGTLLVDLFAYFPFPYEEIEKRASFDSIPALRQVLGRFLSSSDVDLYLLYLDGYTVAEACRKLGINKRGKSSIELKLRKNSVEVVDGLLKLGFECALPFVGVAPSAPVKRFVNSEEERAKRREQIRRYREKRKKCVA